MTFLEALSSLVFAGYLIGFFALTSVAAKRAGRSVWLFGKGAERQQVPAMLFRLSFAGGAIWPLLRHASPGGNDPITTLLDGLALDTIGLLFVIGGSLVALIAQRHMGNSWRIGAAEGEIGTIVDDGPFSLSRNPVFVGQMLLFAGLFLVFPGLVQAALTLALFIAVWLQVRIEERVLTATLGTPYVNYMSRVPRWLSLRRGA